MHSRRDFLKYISITPFASLPSSLRWQKTTGLTQKQSVVTQLSVHVVKVNQRGNWVFVELKNREGLSGFGEASHGETGNTSNGQLNVQQEISFFFGLIKNKSSFSIEEYRQAGWSRARQSRVSSTAFSAIEQALWDLNGKTLGVPVHQLLGGKVRNRIKVYANINRATNERDTNGRRPASAFQKNAEQALKQGFKAIKMAPFDEMKPLPSTPEQIKADIDHAISCLEAVRRTIGGEIDLLTDVHSHLNEQLGIDVAKRVEPLNLYWFEEPVNPGKYPEATKIITDSTAIPTAGGESIFGREGFSGLISTKALDIIMPDAKHCGGLLELKYITALAETEGIVVAPHNPSGPIATAASIQTVATITNFAILELAHGEVQWRSDLVTPPEQFEDGHITVPDRPGFGYDLNREVLSRHAL